MTQLPTHSHDYLLNIMKDLEGFFIIEKLERAVEIKKNYLRVRVREIPQNGSVRKFKPGDTELLYRCITHLRTNITVALHKLPYEHTEENAQEIHDILTNIITCIPSRTIIEALDINDDKLRTRVTMKRRVYFKPLELCDLSRLLQTALSKYAYALNLLLKEENQ